MVASASSNRYILGVRADMLHALRSALHLARVDARVVAVDAA